MADSSARLLWQQMNAAVNSAEMAGRPTTNLKELRTGGPITDACGACQIRLDRSSYAL